MTNRYVKISRIMSSLLNIISVITRLQLSGHNFIFCIRGIDSLKLEIDKTCTLMPNTF